MPGHLEGGLTVVTAQALGLGRGTDGVDSGAGGDVAMTLAAVDGLVGAGLEYVGLVTEAAAHRPGLAGADAQLLGDYAESVAAAAIVEIGRDLALALVTVRAGAGAVVAGQTHIASSRLFTVTARAGRGDEWAISTQMGQMREAGAELGAGGGAAFGVEWPPGFAADVAGATDGRGRGRELLTMAAGIGAGRVVGGGG